VSRPGPAERPVPGVRATSGPSVCYAKHLARVPLPRRRVLRFPAAKTRSAGAERFPKVSCHTFSEFGPGVNLLGIGAFIGETLGER